ncbi:hypothetical protein [Halobellus ruber]|uniref:Uncharacterized protein n=1 Tax=Halobellus ruber TaxID=2761102 RepID=A0A7J9SIZ7_9EURY|nr:hypothetical protein [Halobellus ruber]MBB6646688.1 hypothetical protein [Halobellus ruber]
MGDRESTLRELAAQARGYDAVADAFPAKSFTDRMLVVDLRGDAEGVPEELVALLEANGCYGANEVYDRDAGDRSSAGTVGGADRHEFVDVETRGDHRSYVVDA